MAATAGHAPRFQGGAGQLWFLTVKQFKSYWRMPGYNLLRLSMLLIFGLLYGCLYWQYDIKTGSNTFQMASAVQMIAIQASGPL